jgi:hypothetical protein
MFLFLNYCKKLKCPHLLKPLGTLIQQHYLSFYPSAPIYYEVSAWDVRKGGANVEKTYHLTKTSFIAKCNKRGKIVEGMKSSKIRKDSKKN